MLRSTQEDYLLLHPPSEALCLYENPVINATLKAADKNHNSHVDLVTVM